MSKAKMHRLPPALCGLGLALALGGCGERLESTDMPVPDRANVEINREGLEGAAERKAGLRVERDNTVRMGAGDTSIMDPDVLVAEQVKAALAAHAEFEALPIRVRSRDGDVTLSGRAPDAAARERATEIARSVRAVRSVDNQLTVG